MQLSGLRTEETEEFLHISQLVLTYRMDYEYHFTCRDHPSTIIFCFVRCYNVANKSHQNKLEEKCQQPPSAQD